MTQPIDIEARALSWLKLLVLATRSDALTGPWSLNPCKPGDLVVEATRLFRPVDPDAIGWLVAAGDAPYDVGGKGPRRYIYDVLPLNPNAKLQEWGGQRWENATFHALPSRWVEQAGIVQPQVLFDLIELRGGNDE